MKIVKLIFTALSLTFIFSESKAQLKVVTSGNIGIGQTTPIYKLHVVGDRALFTSTSTTASIYFASMIRCLENNSTASTPDYTWYNDDQTGMFHPAASKIAFTITGSEKLRIDANGNVGIGVTSPGNKLEINSGTANISGLRFTQFTNSSGTSTNTSGNVLSVNANGDIIMVADQTTASAGVIGGTGSSNYVPKWSAGTTLGNSTIYDNGSVGIGTTSPQSKLQVYGGKLYVNQLSANPSGGYAGADLVLGDNASTRNGYGGTNGSHIFLQSSDKSSITALDESNNLGQISYQNLKWTIGEDIGYGGQTIYMPGKLGIGTSSPVVPVDVVANGSGFGMGISANSPTTSGAVALNFYTQANRGLGSQIVGSNTSTGGILFYTNTGATLAMSMLSSGYVGIGTSSPSYLLTVNGQPGANGYTQFTNYSDARLKKNVSNIENSLEKIMKLRPVQYNYNEEYLRLYSDSNSLIRMQMGFIAQEVKEIFPEMVGSVKVKGNDYYDLNLSNLQIYLAQAMQEQQKMIQDLQSQMKNCCTINHLGINNSGTKLNATTIHELELGNSAVLFQNSPNPFGEGTTIKYFVPDNSQAQIIFYDDFGNKVNEFNMQEKGMGQLNVTTINLASGVYSYSLIVNGKVIDTKRMLKN